MKNSRKQPQRVPPPLLSGNERIEGQGILEDFPGDAGLLLWKTFRGVSLWVGLSTAERRDLVSEDAASARAALLEACPELEEIAPALSGLAEMYERPITRPMVVARCRAIERWADARQAHHTALEFGQLAALAAPDDATVAVGVAKRGRDLAEYARAESWYWQAIVRARRTREWEAYVYSMLGLGITHRLRGNYPAARRNMERGLRRARRQGLRQQEGMALHELTVLAMRMNHLGRTLRYGRDALSAYGPGHDRLPWLAHDIAVFWMNQGYFELALEVFSATPDEVGTPSDQFARYVGIARAAGALGRPEIFRWARHHAERLLTVPTTAASAAMGLLDLARGAISLGELEYAVDAAERARDLARARAEAEQEFEAESLLAEARSADAARRVQPVEPPAEVEQLTTELVEYLAVATA